MIGPIAPAPVQVEAAPAPPMPQLPATTFTPAATFTPAPLPSPSLPLPPPVRDGAPRCATASASGGRATRCADSSSRVRRSSCSGGPSGVSIRYDPKYLDTIENLLHELHEENFYLRAAVRGIGDSSRYHSPTQWQVALKVHGPICRWSFAYFYARLGGDPRATCSHGARLPRAGVREMARARAARRGASSLASAPKKSRRRALTW